MRYMPGSGILPVLHYSTPVQESLSGATCRRCQGHCGIQTQTQTQTQSWSWRLEQQLEHWACCSKAAIPRLTKCGSVGACPWRSLEWSTDGNLWVPWKSEWPNKLNSFSRFQGMSSLWSILIPCLSKCMIKFLLKGNAPVLMMVNYI